MGVEELLPGFDTFMSIILGLLLIVWGVAFYMFSLDKNRLGFMRRFTRDRTLIYSSFGLVVFGTVIIYEAFFS